MQDSYAPITSNTTVCAICRSPLDLDTTVTICPGCGAAFHSDCWRENGGCAIYGCSNVPVTTPLSDVEVPVSFWGQEKKNCPHCGAEISAAAIRCRACGTVFPSAQPENSEEYRVRLQLESEQPRLRRRVVMWFVLCMIPLTAPILAPFAALWFWRQRQNITRLPSTHNALRKIGPVIGLAQTAIMLVSIILISILR